MKVLFVMRSTVYVRNFESTLRLLAGRGHTVHVAADSHLAESDALIARLCRECPGITHGPAPAVPFTAWTLLGRELRRGVDYLRYLGAEYANAPKLRLRAERYAPEFVRAAIDRPLFASARGRAVLARVLRGCDRAVPCQPEIGAFIREHGPDLVLVTPLVEPGSPQSECVRCARAEGIPVGLCVYSWDNLTNKGLIHQRLDVVTVWNEAMKREAVELHGVPAERVVVTGAASYDHWFGWRPQTTRETFCARVGLPADRPYLLYLCSSKFIAPDEVSFVRRWVTELRAASPVLERAGVMIRPHPQNTEQWADADLRGFDAVVVWPQAGANPVDDGSRAEYYDSIHHSAAVVGVNTSAQIESAIVGREVYTLLAPEFRETQEGTLHFHHLRDANGGLLHAARTFTEHIAQLEAALAGREDAERRRRFLEGFVRPAGLDAPATPRLVSALEAAARAGSARDRGPWWAPAVRPALRRAAARLARSEAARKEKAAAQERSKQQRDQERAARRAELQAAKAQAATERERRKQQEQERRDAERRAREALEARAYENYRVVRDWARRMQEIGAEPAMSQAERHMRAALAPLWDATPAMVAALRRQAEPVTGVRAADYESRTSDLAPRLKREVGFLRKQAGADLFVHEPSELGGFGFNENGNLYNEETVKFFNVLVALQDAAVLPEHRAGDRRRLVWDIGGGSGGFAYQFKRVCPTVTYVMTGVPEQFLVSAVYLMTLFPGARCRFYETSDDLWRDWDRVDFVFAPESAAAALRPPRLDLTLDLGALREMAAERACAHIQHAYDAGARFFYRLLSARASDAAPCADRTFERLFWPHPVPSRRDPKLAAAADANGERPADPAYAHVVGWRRLRV